LKECNIIVNESVLTNYLQKQVQLLCDCEMRFFLTVITGRRIQQKGKKTGRLKVMNVGKGGGKTRAVKMLLSPSVLVGSASAAASFLA
jgi:hypothetical protein